MFFFEFLLLNIGGFILLVFVLPALNSAEFLITFVGHFPYFFTKSTCEETTLDIFRAPDYFILEEVVENEITTQSLVFLSVQVVEHQDVVFANERTTF